MKKQSIATAGLITIKGDDVVVVRKDYDLAKV